MADMRKSALVLLFPLSLLANPAGPQVIAGVASIHADGSRLSIEASDRAIIEWQSFTIEPGETAEFIQPAIHAAVLNKVAGQLPSSLLGTLLSNGKVLLINPNGILVGPNCLIDTGALALSTLPLLDDAAFLENGPLHFCGESQTYLQQRGTIVANAGDIELIGPSIAIEGKTSSLTGAVRVGAGSDLLLLPEGEERILIQPSNLKTLFGIDLRGQIQALQTELKADGNAYALAICVGDLGSISAVDIAEKEGRVWLVAEEGDVWVKGSINAPGAEVQVLGESVILSETARLDVSSASNPGSIYIGGGYHGAEPSLYTSQKTLVAPGAALSSDALEAGDGGKVILWSDGYTSFHGTIDAKGGPQGGDGGFVEVSGYEKLDYRGQVSTLAPLGKTGSLLLDPYLDITIISAGMTTGVISTPTSFTPMAGFTCAPGPGNSVLLDSDLSAALALNTVTIDTLSTLAPGNPCPGDIIFDPSTVTSWVTPTSDLILSSARDINFRGLMSGSGALSATAQRDINIGSDASFTTTTFTIIQTDGLVLSSVSGSVSIQAGTGLGNSSTLISSTDGVTISAPNGAFQLIGADAAAAAEAFIQVSNNPISVTAQTFLLQGGSSASTCRAQIDSMGNLGVDTYTISGNMSFLGGSSDSNDSNAVIVNLGTNNLSIVCGGQLYMEGGTATMGGTPDARINSSGGGSVFIQAGSVFMQGGDADVADAAIADISGAGGVTVISSGSMSLNTSLGASPSKSIITALGGDLAVTVGGNLTQNGDQAPNYGSNISNVGAGSVTLNVGGNHSIVGSSVFSSGGSVTVSVGGDLSISTTGTETGPIGIVSFSPSPPMSVTAGRDITLIGTNITALGAIFNFGDIQVIAGRNLTVLDWGAIGSAVSGGQVVLVCDNDYPSPPGIGPGAFTTGANAFIGAAGFGIPNDVRIFTSRRSLNSINSQLNGVPFVPGPYLTDTADERWGVYYFDSYYAGSFVLFYKESEALFTSVVPFPDFMELARDLHPFAEYINLNIGFTVSSLLSPDYYFLRKRTYENIDLTDVISRLQDPADQQRPLFDFQ